MNNYCLRHSFVIFLYLCQDILNFLLEQEQPPEFVMEVTDKTKADVKVKWTALVV
jgi:hypothetical protein